MTGSAIHAWITGTFIIIHIAVLSSITWSTDTGVTIDSIDAGSIVLTRQRLAVIYVYITLFASEATGTRASIRGNAIRAGGSILTRIWVCTVININLAVSSIEANVTGAPVLIQFIMALSPILTRLAATFINLFLTKLASKPTVTIASKLINIIHTLSIVLAWIGPTLIYRHITPVTCNGNGQEKWLPTAIGFADLVVKLKELKMSGLALSCMI